MASLKISSMTAATLLDGTEQLALAQSGANEGATLADLARYSADGYFIRQTSAYTLANSTAAQKLFNGSTNGAVTLPTGVYLMQCFVEMSGMSATSGNAAASLAGTATLGSVKHMLSGLDAATITAASNLQNRFDITAATTGNLAVAGTSTLLYFEWYSTFDVTTAGTVIPSLALTTAVATAQVLPGSFLSVRRLCDTGVVTVGPWS